MTLNSTNVSSMLTNLFNKAKANILSEPEMNGPSGSLSAQDLINKNEIMVFYESESRNSERALAFLEGMDLKFRCLEVS